MKVYLVEYSRYNSWGEIKDRHIQEVFRDRQFANSYMIGKALKYAGSDYHVSLTNSGVNVDTMRAEKSNTKAMEEEIVEIRVIEKDLKFLIARE